MTLVAGGELVAAEAREGDGDMTPCLLAEVPGRDRRGVRHRLVEGSDQLGQDRDQIGLHLELAVVRVVALGELPGEAPLVEGLAPGRVADREGMDRRARVLRHQRDERARVDPAGEEAAEGHVRDQPDPDRLVELLAQAGGRILEAHAFVDVVLEIPVSTNRHRAALGDEDVPRAQLLDAFEHGERLGYVEQGEEVVHGGGAQPAPDRGMRQQRLQLRAPDELAVDLGEEELLDADAVAGQQQTLTPIIPDREGEHAAQMGDAVVAPLLVGVDDRLGVGRGGEPVAVGLELLAQLPEVVDLAVEDDPDAPVLVGDRLIAAGEVDDGEPSHAETGAIGAGGIGAGRTGAPSAEDASPLAVGSPMRNDVIHALEHVGRDRAAGSQTVDADYAAHLVIPTAFPLPASSWPRASAIRPSCVHDPPVIRAGSIREPPARTGGGRPNARSRSGCHRRNCARS